MGKAHPVLALIALLLVSFNMRPALSSVAVSIASIHSDTAAAPWTLELITTLPPLCFGVASWAALPIVLRLGETLTIIIASSVLAASLALRAISSVEVLIASTVLGSAAIGAIGVAIPPLIRSQFRASTALVSGVYTTMMCIGGAAAAALTLPFQQALVLRWNGGLAIWSGFALAGAFAMLLYRLVSVPSVGRKDVRAGTNSARQIYRQGLTRSSIAWMLTGFMGFQAALAFIVLGWLPTMLASRGLEQAVAGAITSLSVLAQAVSALLVPAIAGRLKRQHVLVLMCLGAAMLGFVGCAMADIATCGYWSVLLGLGQGGSFGLALVLINLRAASAETTSRLGSMVQALGYLIAALGPLAAGAIWHRTGSLLLESILFVGIAVPAILCGIGCSADSRVS